VPELVGVRQPDAVVLNDDDLSYAKIRFDERSIATLIESIGEFTESLPRALAWVSTWDSLRTGELAASAYSALVLSGAAKETEIGVLQSLQIQAKSAIELYAAPRHREELAQRWALFAHEQLLAAEPGSDIQLAWAKALAASALTDAQLNLLAGLLEGVEQIEGLTVDTDLRWSLLSRLTAMGRAQIAAIDAELENDPTAAGKRHALSCRAAIPTAEAKAEAWASMVESDKLTNEELLAVIAGFKQNEQRELLQLYVGEYFEAVTRLWAERTPHMAQMLVSGLYPILTVDQSVVDAVDAVLAETDEKIVPPALRRMLLEQRDGTLRLLRGQAVDANA
jgi:aminopeptidase N